MKILHYSAVALPLALALATPALALDVKSSVETKAAPAVVWKTIGDFCGIGKWHPAVASCEDVKEGAVETRNLTLGGGGGNLKEALVSRDDKAMTYTYKIVSGPLPVDHYLSTITVHPKGTGSVVNWTGKFDAKGASDADATKVITGIYETGLKAIADKSAM